ncbi:MAG: hypothetical protein ACHQ52_01960 [Candidatus Eisenbacteria bacterium]
MRRSPQRSIVSIDQAGSPRHFPLPRIHPARVSCGIAAIALLAIGACRFLSPADVFDISGRLESAFGCEVVESGGRSYELSSWPAPEPPLDSYVILRVRALHGYASTCMVGQIVQVLRVKKVVTDFRTAPVSGFETWGPASGPITIGRVEVLPGASLTVLPGTVIRITDHGELRVRGSLSMIGATGDSIRVSGTVVLDSAQADTRIAFTSLRNVLVHGSGPPLEHLTTYGVRVENGTVALVASSTRAVSVMQARFQSDQCELGNVDAVDGDLHVTGSTLSRLQLSYSQAGVSGCRFIGGFSYVVFHGASGGRLEGNTFETDSTVLEIRHTSDPDIHHDDFLSRRYTVRCESRELSTCVRMEQNWWGSADEDQIRAHFGAGATLCFIPWLTAPWNHAPGPTVSGPTGPGPRMRVR